MFGDKGELLVAKIGLIRTYIANQHNGIRASILNKLVWLEEELKSYKKRAVWKTQTTLLEWISAL